MTNVFEIKSNQIKSREHKEIVIVLKFKQSNRRILKRLNLAVMESFHQNEDNTEGQSSRLSLVVSNHKIDSIKIRFGWKNTSNTILYFTRTLLD